MSEKSQMPFSEEGELAVIACILHNPEDALDACIEKGVNVDHFFIPAHRIIIREVGNMVADGKRVDVITLLDQMKKSGTISRVGGADAIYHMMDAHFTMAHMDYYIDLLKQAEVRRSIIEVCRYGMNSATEVENPEELRAECESKFLDMRRNIEVKDVKSIFREMRSEMQKGMNGEVIEIGLSTGFPELDDYNEGGMRRKGVYFLSGHENTGKTSMKCNIIRNILLAGKRVADLTLEMSVRDELERLTSIHCSTNVGRVIRGKQGANMDLVQDAQDLFVNSGRLHIADQENVGSDTELMSWARRMVSKYRVDLITIDYFQLIEISWGNRLSIEESTSKKSEVVKKIAGKLDVPVLCVAAINAEGKIRGSRMADYDGAGHWRLEDDDVGDSTASPPHYDRNISLVTQKARYGIPFKRVPLTFRGSTGRFSSRGATKEEIDELDRYFSNNRRDRERPEQFDQTEIL